MSGVYKPIPCEYTQELVQRLVQSVFHLNYHISTGTYHEDFETTFDGCTVQFSKERLVYTNVTEPDLAMALNFTWGSLADAKVPQLESMSQIPQSIIQSLGRTLRHWVDTL